MSDDDLIADIQKQWDTMVAVATGGSSIQSANDEYRERRLRIQRGLGKRGLVDPNPHGDLWAWYGRWRRGDLPTYQSRREYVAALYQPIVDIITKRAGREGDLRVPEPTGWGRVDRAVEKLASQLETAVHEEDFQTVGLLCREALISVAQAVYDPDRHRTADGTTPSDTDANRMLEGFFTAELSGGPNEEMRKHAKASLSLTVALQHRRTADYRHAALCAEATTSVINIVSVLSGRSVTPRASPESCEPFRIPATGDPELDRIETFYRLEGEEAYLGRAERRDVLLARGCRIAHYPGTQREVWVGNEKHGSQHILVLKPKKPTVQE